MDRRSLFPPYINSMNDRIIGGVEQRIGRFDRDNIKTPHCYRPPLRPHADEIKPTPECTQMHKPTEQYKPKLSASRREQCRINQARYRSRQRQYAKDLNDSIHQLEDEIQRLEAKKQNVFIHLSTEQTVWIVATAYFRHFRHGYMGPSPTATGKTQHIQLDFLKEAMASDVTDGVVSGVEALLEKWRLFSLFHSDVNVQLKTVKQHPCGSLVASTTTSLTITENTLRHLYPHLINEGKWSPLALKLLNQRVLVHGSVWFGWDEPTKRVARLETKIGMLTAMLTLVDNVENVTRVFDGAWVTPDGVVSDSRRM